MPGEISKNIIDNLGVINYTVNDNGFVCLTDEKGNVYESGFTEAGFKIIVLNALGQLSS